MLPVSAEGHAALVENVKTIIREKLEPKQAKLLAAFAESFYGSVSQEDVNSRSPNELYGAILNLWLFMQDYSRGETKIRIFNPTLEQHGWQSNQTIIEILIEDMPFLVDSLLMLFNKKGINTHLFIHVPLAISRSKNKQVSAVEKKPPEAESHLETPMYLEIDRIEDLESIEALKAEISDVLEDVRLVVKDWRPMQMKLNEVIEEIESVKLNEEVTEEAIAFLNWVASDHFTFMGYRHHKVKAVKGDYQKAPQVKSAIGLKKKFNMEPQFYSNLTQEAKRMALDKNQLLIINKSELVSRVHRPANIDYIGIKQFDENGEIIGEHGFIGLYTSAAYNASPIQIPLLRQKFEKVLQASGLLNKSHDYKTLTNILETYPRDELIQIDLPTLLEISMGILHLQERQIIKAFVRRDVYGRYFSVLLFAPREMYNTALRHRITRILKKHFKASGDVQFRTRFSESILARIHFIIPVDASQEIPYDVQNIEKEIKAAARSWVDNLREVIVNEYGEVEGGKIFKRYKGAFPEGYKEQNTVATALVDIKHLQSLTNEKKLSMLLYRPLEETEVTLRFKLFLFDQPAPLSEVLPILESLGLKVMGETPYRIKPERTAARWILDFQMTTEGKVGFSVEDIKVMFQEAFASVWNGQSDIDGFNHLVLKANLSWREITILRAYARYMWQIGYNFSRQSVADALVSHPEIAKKIITLFSLRFSPSADSDQREYLSLLEAIETDLEQVHNLNVDRILRHFVELVRATLRTNYYQLDDAGKAKEYLSFKLDPRAISEMPRPKPMYEIFVYSAKVEGVHLRGGKIARGGLRWSDRRDDYRTEVLGLVKAQQVKNAVIVPVGAKGGFVCKQLNDSMTRDEFRQEGETCYQLFIQGLLDITDNYEGDKLVKPINVVCHDEDDPYLVVAADKGTATFSDIANGIAEKYQFWLGDSFASGGSVGYDHKKMGITARGAWESVKRHFREIGVDCQTTDFTVVGIGDMAGDVFGNGMLLSKHIRLVAAFNHMHIFIDPEPDSGSSFEERQRLFNLPGSSWADYNTNLISKGGGIFSRSAKAIVLSPELQKLFKTTKKSMPPNELMRSILKLKVDLLWNGGIGTYIKAQNEVDSDVGDRANEAIRINGKELRCRIVGEGGNLGMTQLGRIEYMLKGGRANTDFIDNVGGVDCSDHEVNIKILLNAVVVAGDMTLKQRNELLAEMTDAVAAKVLRNNYRQIQSISITEARSRHMVKEHARFINDLERSGKLDRSLEFLPTEEELIERLSQGKGLTRAELAVLLAYGKMGLKEELNTPQLTDDEFFNDVLIQYFPKPLQKRYMKTMADHRLRSEIIATNLANDIVNFMGSNIVYRLNDETGAEPAEIARCFAVAKEIFDLETLWKSIEALDNQVECSVQLAMMHQCQRTVRRATRWFLRRGLGGMSIRKTINYYKEGLRILKPKLADLLEPLEAEGLAADAAAYQARGVPNDLACDIANLSTLFSCLDLVLVVDEVNLDMETVAEVYFKLGVKLELHWFLDQINLQPVDNHWQAFARGAFREELDWLQMRLTKAVLVLTQECDTPEQRVETWFTKHAQVIRRWNQTLADFRTTVNHEFAKFSVALRELLIIVQACQRDESQLGDKSRLSQEKNIENLKAG